MVRICIRVDPCLPATKPDRRARRVRASELLGPEGRVLIEHAGETYELRVTRNDKLILTK